MQARTTEQLNQFLTEQSNEPILPAFKQTCTYQPNSFRIVTHEPSIKACRTAQSSTASKQVFYYYLNMLPSSLRSRYHSFSNTMQQAIKRAFRAQPLDSVQQAVSQLTLQLTNGATKC